MLLLAQYRVTRLHLLLKRGNGVNRINLGNRRETQLN
jgi:hypothetical protein